MINDNNYFSCNQFVFQLCVWHTVPRGYILGKFPWRRRCDSDINSWLVVRQSVMNTEDKRRGKWAVLRSNCTSRHVTLYRFHQIQVNFTVFWPIIELLIGDLYNQGRCDRHTRQLYGSVAGNLGDIFFSALVFANLWFCMSNSAQMATMAISNANRHCCECFLS